MSCWAHAVQVSAILFVIPENDALHCKYMFTQLTLLQGKQDKNLPSHSPGFVHTIVD